MKKNGFPITVDRVFTRSGIDAWKLIHFRECDDPNEDPVVPLECPDNWSDEAALLLIENASFGAIPTGKKAVEENTVPSWLWKRRQAAQLAPAETGPRDIFDRVVGAATYAGWKEDIFADEAAAHAFHDEARYALAQRFMAIDPHALATLGLDWAYGVEQDPLRVSTSRVTAAVDISNTLIDQVVSGSRDKNTRSRWQKVTQVHEQASVDLRFADTSAEWEISAAAAIPAFIDLMACRHNDGTVNILALRHLVRLLVVTLDLTTVDETRLAVGFANLAPLLMALALPYDSKEGRTFAAALAAIVTAEAFAASAELAAARGPSARFIETREKTLRTLRNHRRAAYGEHTDYEKISVLPVALELEDCPDLALAAAARSAWDDALQLSQNYGLRALQVTTLVPSPEIAFFMESLTQGLEPMRALTVTHLEGATSSKALHPSMKEGLQRLDYTQAQVKAISHYIVGTPKLDKAPGVNTAALRALKFDKVSLARIEAYLPQATNLRFAITPWMVSDAFRRDVLKLNAQEIQNPRFDMLTHLGFTKKNISDANLYIYGSASLASAPELSARHVSVFATEAEITPEARIRMAAAVQGFVSGATGLQLSLPLSLPTEKIEKLLLSAWRQGIRNLTIDYDAAMSASLTLPSKDSVNSKSTRKIKPSAFANAKAPSLPQRKSKGKTGGDVTARSKSKTSRRNWAG